MSTKISIYNLPVGLFKIDSNKKMIYVNKLFCKISGYPKKKLLDENWLHTIHPEDVHVFILPLEEHMKNQTPFKFEFRFTYPNEEDSWVLCHLIPEESNKTDLSFIGTITDINEFKKTQEALQHLAWFDPLTQLPNRYMFEDILSKSLDRAKRNGTILALFYIDIDYFKNVNDFFGHGVGDFLLQEACARLKNTVRYGDFIVRLGGDEFAIIFEDIYKISIISFAAQRFVEEFRKPFIIDDHEISATLSLGISVYPDEDTTTETIVQHADQALYQAKEAGRNCYKYYNKNLQQKLDRYMLIVKHLRNAISENQLELCYQPKINCETNSMVGMEALLRWNNALVNASPDEFIVVAEETGLISQIGEWVIKTSLSQFKTWYEKNNKMKNVSISINISPSQLNDSKIIDTVTKILKETDLPTQNILFELTETAVMKKALDNKSLLQTFLAELGIGISIDDFGTGYSSFTYLNKLPIKELKIDKSFIEDIGKNKKNEAIIKVIINLALTLNIDVTAEGVSTKEQLDYLKENNCRIIQGYYYSKPLNVVEMTKYIDLSA